MLPLGELSLFLVAKSDQIEILLHFRLGRIVMIGSRVNGQRYSASKSESNVGTAAFRAELTFDFEVDDTSFPS